MKNFSLKCLVLCIAGLGLSACGGGGGDGAASGDDSSAASSASSSSSSSQSSTSSSASSSSSSSSSSVATRTTPEGLWTGKVGAYDLAALFLDSKQFYMMYSYNGAVYGVVAGSANDDARSSFVAAARDFNVANGYINFSAVTGNYQPMASLSGELTELGGTLRPAYDGFKFNATYVPDYDVPADLSSIAGTYRGDTATGSGVASISITIDKVGNLSGFSPGYYGLCTFQGTAKPHPGGKNVLDVSVKFNGSTCALGTATVWGNAVPVVSNGRRMLYAVGLLADHSDGFIAIGTRQ